MVMLHPGNAPKGFVPAPAVQPEKDMPAIKITKFFTKYREPLPGSDQTVLREEHWVEWVKIGEQNGSTCVEAVHRIGPTDRHPPRIEWHVIGPAYEAWLKGNEAPETGTPLFSWSGITRELVEVLAKFNVKTLEDLVAMADHNLAKVPVPNLRQIRHRAKLTLDAAHMNEIGQELAGRDAQIEALKSNERTMQAQLDALTAQLQALSKSQGFAISALGGNAPHPDDEFVELKPGDRHVSPASGFSRRDPVDHIDVALGDVAGVHVTDDEIGDEDVTD